MRKPTAPFAPRTIRTLSRSRVAFAVATALLVAACGGEMGEAPDDASAASAESGASPAAGSATTATTDGPRVPVSPTSEDELPSAILGEGGALQGVDLQYVPGDDVTTGYLAVPEGEGPFPGMVIVHEWNGLVDRVRQMADDLAAEGYVTLAVDLYDARTGSNSEENRALIAEVQADPEKMIANMNAAVAYLKGRPDVSGRVGTMGWCFGGGIVLTYGLDGGDHEATAIFYGSLLDDPERLAALDHEVYGTFAELDGGIPPESVAAFEAALAEAGVERDLHVYDDVDHGFWLRVDEDPELRTAPALDAWQRLKAYLGRTLGAAM